jgi:hypothetical protein
LVVVCSGCGSALGEGARFCSSCGAAAPAAPKETRETVGVARSAGGLLGRSLLAEAPTPTPEAAPRRPADEGWSAEPTTARGLVMRRSVPARQPLPPVADAPTREELLASVLSDDATARPREQSGLAALLGGRRGR